MANPREAAGVPDALPPIILLIGDGSRVAEYAGAFESEGLWVSAVTVPAEVVPAAFDLSPDAIVADIPHGAGAFLMPLHALKSNPRTQQIPVIAVGAGPPADDAEAAFDLWMPTPTSDHVLVHQVRELVRQSHRLRATSADARRRARALVEHSNRVIVRREGSTKHIGAATRLCPKCDHALALIERGQIGSIDYEYYRWCERGCGLYCFDCAAQKWVKLA
jgi:CheY-like chemotaxis protein